MIFFSWGRRELVVRLGERVLLIIVRSIVCQLFSLSKVFYGLLGDMAEFCLRDFNLLRLDFEALN